MPTKLVRVTAHIASALVPVLLAAQAVPARPSLDSESIRRAEIAAVGRGWGVIRYFTAAGVTHAATVDAAVVGVLRQLDRPLDAARYRMALETLASSAGPGVAFVADERTSGKD